MVGPNGNNRESIAVVSNDTTRLMVNVLCNQRAGLQVCHINAPSLLPKIDEFRYLFEGSKVDVVCVTETWFSPDLSDALCGLHGYNLFRCDRVGRIGGGVAIYVRCGFYSRLVRESPPGSRIEYLFVEIVCKENKILLGSAYRPIKHIDATPLIAVLDELTFVSPLVILAGDFNSNILRESSLVDSMRTLGLSSVNTSTPTHFTKDSSTLLDVFFVSHLNKVLHYSQLSASCFSHHDLIHLTYQCEPAILNTSYSFRDFRNINMNQLEEDFRSVEWFRVYAMPSVDEQVSFVQGNIDRLFNTHVPLKTKTVKAKEHPWFTNSIKALITKRNQAYKSWKRFRLDVLLNVYRVLRNQVTSEIREAKRRFYAPRLDSSLTGRKLWKNLRDIGMGKRVNRNLPNIDCNELNRNFTSLSSLEIDNNLAPLCIQDTTHNAHFPTGFSFTAVDEADVLESCISIKSNSVGFDEIHPVFVKATLPYTLKYITHLFNTIFMTGNFPTVWKRTKIVPIPKNRNEYRPIAILPFLSKMLERIMNRQVRNFLSSNNMLCINQSGFRPKHSCTTALINVVEEIRQAADDGNVTFLTLLDFSKAFDTVNHNVLCSKLRNQFQFSPPSINLIYSYLYGRFQAVVSNNSVSTFLPLSRGVPQGSILGPLLFALYINELPSLSLHSSIHIYADDVQLCNSCPLGLVENGACEVNEDLYKILNWSQSNGLCLNPTKSKCLVISRTPIDTSYFPQIRLNSEPIEFVDSAKNLGITFSKTLKWNDHIRLTIGKVYGGLRMLWATQRITPLRTRMILAKTLLIPVLLFGCEIFSNCDYEHMRRLNVVYNGVARYIYGRRRYDHISSFSKSIHGFTLENLFAFRTLIMLHNVMQTRQPPYLYNKIRFPRSTRSCDLVPIRYSFLVSERQFFINAIRLWNSLPRAIRVIGCTTQFKVSLRQHLQAL